MGPAPVFFVQCQVGAHYHHEGGKQEEDEIDGQRLRCVGHVDQQHGAPEDDRPPYLLPAEDEPGSVMGQ